MKKFISTILLIGVLMTVCSCAVVKITDDGPSYSVTNKDIGVYMMNNGDKITRDAKFMGNGKNSIYINMVKREIEGAQFLLRCDVSDLKNVSAHISELKNADGVAFPAEHFEIFRERYMLIDRVPNKEPAYYPDALIPLFDDGVSNNSITVNKGENQAFYIKVRTTEDTLPGVYTGKVTVSTDIGTVEVPVTVNVNDITLPFVPTSKSMILRWSGVDDMYGEKGFDMTYEFLLDHKLNIDRYTADSTKFLQCVEKYGLDPRVQAFNIPHYVSVDPETGYFTVLKWKQKQDRDAVRALGEKYGIPDLVDKCYFYKMDEISKEQAPIAQDLCTQLNEIDPTFKSFITLSPSVTAMDGYLNVWCLNHSADRDSVERIRENGAMEVWWYGSEGFLVGLDENVTGKSTFWTQKDYDIEGYLNWAFDNYTKYIVESGEYVGTRDFWNDPYCFEPSENFMAYGGDGYLVYAANKNDGIVNRDMIVSSLRMEQMTDGIEDYDLLTIREKQIQKRLDELKIKDLTPNDFMRHFYDAFNNEVTANGNSTYDEVLKYQEVRDLLIKEILEDSDILVSVKTMNDYADTAHKTVTVVGVSGDTVKVNGKILTKQGDCFVTEVENLFVRSEITVEADGATKTLPFYPRRIVDSVILADYVKDGAVAPEKLPPFVSLTEEGLRIDFTENYRFDCNPSMWDNKFTDWSDYYQFVIKFKNTGDKTIPELTVAPGGNRNVDMVSGKYYNIEPGEEVYLTFHPQLGGDVRRVNKVRFINPSQIGEITVEYMYLFNLEN